MINVLTGPENSSVSNRQELLERLSRTGLEIRIAPLAGRCGAEIQARIVISEIDNWEKDHFPRRNNTVARSVETAGTSQEPDRPGLIDGAVDARRIENWIDGERYRPCPLPPFCAPLLIG